MKHHPLIPVLFTEKNSNYLSFAQFDCYDISRNALSFSERIPLIAHPPCRKFCRLRSFSTAPVAEKKLAFFALARIRQFGGILEHPRSSTLWQTGNFDLTGRIDKYGGFLRSVNLSWFGYPAEKKTMLYFCGISPIQLPQFPLSLLPPTYTISTSKKKRLPELPAKFRSSTPDALIDFFIETLSIITLNLEK